MTREYLRKLNLGLIAFFALGLAVYYLFHIQPYLEIARYDLLLNSPFSAPELANQNILAMPAEASPAPVPAENMVLHVLKISVDAPIVEPLDPSTQGVLASLESGVGLFPDSVKPGKAGRAVILGHSSRASWYRGNYAYVFSLLSKMEKGDEFYISTSDQKLLYRVFDVLTLSPADANKLTAGPAQGSEVDLITCYPVGSASQRTVVRAELIGTANL